MNKYHLNSKDEVKVCNATKHKCSFPISGSKEEVLAAYKLKFGEDYVAPVSAQNLSLIKGLTNTETVGISAEVAICDIYGLEVNPLYRVRASQDIIDAIVPFVKETIDSSDMPNPSKHLAEGQNAIDFLLEEGKSMSLKSNMRELGKVAPQILGQPSSGTYFKHFGDLVSGPIPSSYEDKTELFKHISIHNIDEVIKRYWDHLFHCDYLVYIHDVFDKNRQLNTESINSFVISKIDSPNWVFENFTFTQSLDSWNSSNTVKYLGLSIGEFQIHKNRDCFKFRFNMSNIIKLIEQGLI